MFTLKRALVVIAVALALAACKDDPIYQGATDWRVAVCNADGGHPVRLNANGYSYCSFGNLTYPTLQRTLDVGEMVAIDWGLPVGFVQDFSVHIVTATWRD